MAISRKNATKAPPLGADVVPEPVGDTLNPKQELFCRYYAQGEGQGCSTLSTDAPLQKGIKALQSRGVSVLTEGTSLVST